SSDVCSSDLPWPRYRIVGLVHLGEGHLLAAFDGRETGQDVSDPTGLLQRRSLDGGRTWGPFESLRDADREGRHWFCDPSYIHNRLTGAVHVFYSHAKVRGVSHAVAGTVELARDVLQAVDVTRDDRVRSWPRRSVPALAVRPDLLRTA